MEIANVHYALSKPIEKYSEIKTAVKELIKFMEEFKPKRGYYEKVFCLSHAEVCDTPYAFFVVVKDLVDAKMFPSQVIINPEIIEAPEEITVDGIKDRGDGTAMYGPVVRSNHIRLTEGCIQFPFRSPKKVDRLFKVKVRYFTQGILGLKKHEEWAEDSKAHVFQHNCDHIQGKNIFFDSPEKIEWWKLTGGGYKDRKEINLITKVK
jgi:peptide deformylase